VRKEELKKARQEAGRERVSEEGRIGTSIESTKEWRKVER